MEIDGADQLFFSRSSATVPGDIFVSREFGPASAVSELNSAGNDIQPNVRKDGRELVFSSNHAHPGAKGGQDIYVSTRASTDGPWSAPLNLGRCCEHERPRVAPVAVMGRAHAALWPRTWARGNV